MVRFKLLDDVIVGCWTRDQEVVGLIPAWVAIR